MSQARCGFDKSYCDDCARPAVMREFCRSYHRAIFEAREILNHIPDKNERATAVSTLIELLTSSALDTALDATGRPSTAVQIIRQLCLDRLDELMKKGQIRPATPAEQPRPTEKIH